ncbi:hypothetical protein Fmac_025675 [Flemingia macrophylla]|uniref:Uncharacterized protein n=1 Tax=Flemingia macrophylla TaxID=520843 RepID=A0ABD1LSW6_9FABA
MLYFHSFRNPGLILDIVQGGGIPKHHICNANMMRNGADYAIFINTAQEFDGSDSGARPDEAVSWEKIRGSAKTVKDLDGPVFRWIKRNFQILIQRAVLVVDVADDHVVVSARLVRLWKKIDREADSAKCATLAWKANST